MWLTTLGEVHVCQLSSLRCAAACQRPRQRTSTPTAHTPAAARLSRSPARQLSTVQHGRCNALRASQNNAALGSLSPSEQEQADPQDATDTEQEEDSEDWGDEFNDTLVGLSEEELTAQEAVFAQNVLTNDVMSEDPPDHATGYVALVGRPNAGKSTLLNALLGQKLSAVTQKAQTTRHRILGIVSEEAFQLILLDTPGVIKSLRTELDNKMMHNVNTAVQQADALLVIVDAMSNLAEVLEMPGMQPGWEGPPAALVLNKTDLLTEDQLQIATKWLQANTAATAVLPTAAISKAGIDAVQQWAVTQLPLGPTLYPKDSISEQSERFFVAEIVREKIFQQYHQEIPYSTAVQVTDFKEREGRGKDYIQVSVYVESDSQRPILLGRKGSQLKKLSTDSRLAIEQFLGRQVYLDISIKVAPKWRLDQTLLEQYGY